MRYEDHEKKCAIAAAVAREQEYARLLEQKYAQVRRQMEEEEKQALMQSVISTSSVSIEGVHTTSTAIYPNGSGVSTVALPNGYMVGYADSGACTTGTGLILQGSSLRSPEYESALWGDQYPVLSDCKQRQMWLEGSWNLNEDEKEETMKKSLTQLEWDNSVCWPNTPNKPTAQDTFNKVTDPTQGGIAAALARTKECLTQCITHSDYVGVERQKKLDKAFDALAPHIDKVLDSIMPRKAKSKAKVKPPIAGLTTVAPERGYQGLGFNDDL